MSPALHPALSGPWAGGLEDERLRALLREDAPQGDLRGAVALGAGRLQRPAVQAFGQLLQQRVRPLRQRRLRVRRPQQGLQLLHQALRQPLRQQGVVADVFGSVFAPLEHEDEVFRDHLGRIDDDGIGVDRIARRFRRLRDARRLCGRQVQTDRDGRHRRGDHEDDHQHQQNVDERRDVDIRRLFDGVLVPAGTTDLRSHAPSPLLAGRRMRRHSLWIARKLDRFLAFRSPLVKRF